jgi:hypothetical protein
VPTTVPMGAFMDGYRERTVEIDGALAETDPVREETHLVPKKTDRVREDRDLIAIGRRPKSPTTRLLGWLAVCIGSAVYPVAMGGGPVDWHTHPLFWALGWVSLAAATYNGYKLLIWSFSPDRYIEKYVPAEPASTPKELGPRAGLLILLTREPTSTEQLAKAYAENHKPSLFASDNGFAKRLAELRSAGLIKRTTEGSFCRVSRTRTTEGSLFHVGRTRFYSLTDKGLSKKQGLRQGAEVASESGDPSRPPPMQARTGT